MTLQHSDSTILYNDFFVYSTMLFWDKSLRFVGICESKVFFSMYQCNKIREVQAMRKLSSHANIVKLREMI